VELSQILKRLWAGKLALLAVVLVALAAAVKMAGRSAPATGAATAQILVDSPQSALANLKQNTLPLTTRAGVFAQFMASSAVRDAIAHSTNIPADEILAQGPFDDPAAAPTGADAPKPPDTASLSRGKRYRLLFVSQQDLPLVTVYAQAPTAREAAALADGVGKGVQEYVDRLQTQGELEASRRVVIRALGPAEAGTVQPGSSLPMAIAAFLGVLVFGCVALLVVYRLAAARRERDTEGWDDAASVELFDFPSSSDDPDPELSARAS
jgi:capsular polysaccharide biosynthesis protein